MAVIEALYELGVALGYSAQREHTVGQSAAVDLSWTAADSNDVPLFIFEVESTASTGLANNAMKVYGSPMSDLPRPLFFFHLVLKGSKANERIRNAHIAWGQHNYRVYRFGDKDDRSALALDILRQHRRVSRFLQPAALAAALNNAVWGGRSTVKDALKLAEKLRFDAPYLHDYANMARNDISYLDLFVSRLRYLDELPADADRKHLSQEGYGGGPGEYIPGLFEVGLRIYAGDIPDSEGPFAFERWATGPRFGPRVIDAAFGLDRDYDWYVIGVAPIDYALTAALLTAHPASRDWVLQDFSSLLARERSSGLPPRYRLPGSVWLAHLLCATRVNGSSPARTELAINSLYADLQAHVVEGGGIPENLLTEPPGASGDIHEKPYWWDDPNNVSLPVLEDLLAKATTHLLGVSAGAMRADPATLCLTSLVRYDIYESPTQELLKVIYDQ
ncbi:hypothetical protein [Arthrobacter sp. S39]|uniref:hypothetical protein n=1 Tax=Arthrobacter sp. S39 TaxID=2509720 RepID=UPI001037416E|nr:hypothetical protein [Arthrobacter sp. S39]TAP39059.1 hypothetical protein EYS21_22930 [Arthrobacter sp. S39]